MRLVDRKTKVPALSLPSERDAEGDLTNAVRAQFGRTAVDVGTPDRGQNEDRTDSVDAVANILHWLNDREIDPAAVLESAWGHFLAEIPPQSIESLALDILQAAGIAPTCSTPAAASGLLRSAPRRSPAARCG